MIHSLAGGELRETQICNIAKVQILAGDNPMLFFVCNQKNIKVGDIVLVPYGKLDDLVKAKVVRVDKNVDMPNFPISASKLKSIFAKAK